VDESATGSVNSLLAFVRSQRLSSRLLVGDPNNSDEADALRRAATTVRPERGGKRDACPEKRNSFASRCR